MSVMEKLTAVADRVPLHYAAGKKDCEGRHFVTTVTGDDGRTLEFSVPFTPDFVSIACYDPRSVAQTGAVIQFCVDRRALSNLAGFALSGRELTPYYAGLTHSGLQTRLFFADGKVTVKDLPSTQGATKASFAKELTYVVVAQKYTEQTDLERLTAFMQALAGKSGTFTLSKKLVTEVFTGADEEDPDTGESMNEDWNALKRQYAANCTIALA